MIRRTGDWPNLVGQGRHVAGTVSWRRAVGVMVGAGLGACLLGAVLIPVLLAPAAAAPIPVLASIPVVVPTPESTPEPDLVPGVVSMARVTETIGASQAGDASPVTYSVPRIMQEGAVKLQLTSVTASHPREGWREVEQASQTFRFELVDALDGTVLGSVDVTREEGVDPAPVTLATLDAPHATFIRVAAEVRGTGTCVGCGNDEDFYETALFHRWSAVIEYYRASWAG